MIISRLPCRPTHALKPLPEGEHEGEDFSSRRGARTGTGALAGMEGTNPMLASMPQQAQHAQQAGDASSEGSGSQNPSAGGSLHGSLSSLQRRMQQAYGGVDGA
jgi:hypothetical protein